MPDLPADTPNEPTHAIVPWHAYRYLNDHQQKTSTSGMHALFLAVDGDAALGVPTPWTKAETAVHYTSLSVR